jgi:hypothetical protein
MVRELIAGRLCEEAILPTHEHQHREHGYREAHTRELACSSGADAWRSGRKVFDKNSWPGVVMRLADGGTEDGDRPRAPLGRRREKCVLGNRAIGDQSAIRYASEDDDDRTGLCSISAQAARYPDLRWRKS